MVSSDSVDCFCVLSEKLKKAILDNKGCLIGL
jgi:hypothetical protein